MSSKFFIDNKILFFKWGSNPIKLRSFSKKSHARQAKKELAELWPTLTKKKSLDQIIDAFQCQIDKSFNDGQMGFELLLK